MFSQQFRQAFSGSFRRRRKTTPVVPVKVGFAAIISRNASQYTNSPLPVLQSLPVSDTDCLTEIDITIENEQSMVASGFNIQGSTTVLSGFDPIIDFDIEEGERQVLTFSGDINNRSEVNTFITQILSTELTRQEIVSNINRIRRTAVQQARRLNTLTSIMIIEIAREFDLITDAVEQRMEVEVEQTVGQNQSFDPIYESMRLLLVRSDPSINNPYRPNSLALQPGDNTQTVPNAYPREKDLLLQTSMIPISKGFYNNVQEFKSSIGTKRTLDPNAVMKLIIQQTVPEGEPDCPDIIMLVQVVLFLRN